MSFKLGQTVTWTSQAGGHAKTKTGRVVAVIAGGRGSGDRASKYIRDAKRSGTHRSCFGGGWDRNSESYVVEVRDGRTSRAKPILYWPVVSLLQEATS